MEREAQTRDLKLQAAVIDRVARDGQVRIIFDAAVEETLWLAANVFGALRATGRSNEFRTFPLLGRAAANVDGETLLALIASGATTHIELDAIHRPALLSSVQVIRADEAHHQDLDGDGQVIAILDTGVDTGHPMYSLRLIEEACFSLLGDCPNGRSSMFGLGAAVPCSASSCGHGTAVAGIALGSEPGGPLRGVAPAARLIAIQVFSLINGEIGAFSSDVLAGLQHVLSLSSGYDIASVNLSLGGQTYATTEACDAHGAAHYFAVAALRSQGIATVAAAGNNSQADELATPACLSNVISVGATSDDDLVPDFSNSAAFLSLLAPGRSIESSREGGGTAIVGGTSMATPHVSGAIAVIAEAYPGATVTQIENALALSGAPTIDARSGLTTPRVDVAAALALLAEASPPPSEEPPPAPPPGEESGDQPVATAAGGGGSSACGLVGFEPFVVLAAIQLVRFRRSASRARR